MRLLHTSDWHLGRSFHRVGMLDAQAAFVDHLVDVVRSEAVDVVLVAGDIYDRALPGVDVVALLDEALSRLVGAGATVVMTSGNHDSATRLSFASSLLEGARVHIRTAAGRCADPVVLADEHGEVLIYPLPYLEPVLVAQELECDPGHAAALGAAMDAVRRDLASRTAARGRARSVISAHGFVVGGQVSDSERDISVGGVAAVPASVFDGVDYAALGHLHRRQQITPTVRYSGSPLAYSFSEHGQVKGSLLVQLGADGVTAVDPIDAPVPRPLALLRGELDDLLRRDDLAEHEQAWCQITLTDAARPAQAMERLRTRFPHTLELRFEPAGLAASESITVRRTVDRSDLEVCQTFVAEVRGRPASPAETHWLRTAIEALRLHDMEAAGVAALRHAERRRSVAADPAPAERIPAEGIPAEGTPEADAGNEAAQNPAAQNAATADAGAAVVDLTAEQSADGGEQVAFAFGEAG